MEQVRYGKVVKGVCKICEAEGYTEIHHIISQSKIRKLNRPDLTTNPNNLIELCKTCHDWTDSSTYALWYRRQGGNNGGKRKRRTREEVKEHRKQSEKEEGCCSAKGISKAVADVKWASVRKLLAIAIFIDTNGTPKKKKNENEKVLSFT